MTSIPQATNGGRARFLSSLPLLLLLALAFQWFSRYAGAPVTDFAVDDWRLYLVGTRCASFADALDAMLRFTDRPFAALPLVYLYHVFGDQPWLHALYSYAVTAAFLGFALLATHELTGSRFVTLVTGLLFSLLPTLTENFSWYTMATPYGLGYAAYPACAWLWIRFLKTGRMAALAGAALAYLLALGSYEIGIALPAALLLLTRRENRRSAALGAGLLFSVAVLYAAWRVTNGFGLGHDPFHPHRDVGIALNPWRWKIAEAVRWWIGSHFRDSFLNGCLGYASLPASRQHLLTLLSVLATAAACLLLKALHKKERDTAPAFPTTQVALFAGAWFVTAQATNVISWSGPRLCYVPAWGAALLVALLLARLRPATWMPLLAAASLMGLAANHGTAQQWHDAGQFQRQLYNHLRASRPQWEKADVLLIDSRSLRSRLHQGLLDATPQRAERFAFYGNAGLLRGFSVKAMVDLIDGGREHPVVVLDVEHNARIDGQELVWTAWYDPSSSTRTPMDRVYVVEALRFAGDPDAPPQP